MKRLLIPILAALFLSAPNASAQIGFDFGMNTEFLNRKAPAGKKASAFGMGPYVGLIYGVPVSMSNMLTVGLNYQYNIIFGAPGAWNDENKLDPLTLWNGDTDIRESHLQIPVMLNHEAGLFNISAGPVLDYCLASTVSSTQTNWPYKDDAGKAKKIDSVKDLGVKPFNIYLKAGAGVGLKRFSFNITAGYGLFDLSPDSYALHRWIIGLDFHLIF